jgi:hypothetical protein
MIWLTVLANPDDSRETVIRSLLYEKRQLMVLEA